MAETGKLIDADALVELLQKEIEDNPTSYFAHEYKCQIAFLRKASDASEPLRKRIAELEGALDDLVCACELPGDHCEVEDALPAARAALLKGAQDA